MVALVRTVGTEQTGGELLTAAEDASPRGGSAGDGPKLNAIPGTRRLAGAARGWSVPSGARQDLDRVADGTLAGGVGRDVDEAATDGHGGGAAAVQVERLYRAE